MRRALLLALILFALPASAANRYVAATGDWDDVGTWNDDGCGQAADASVAPTAADAVFLCPGVTVTVPCNYDAVLLSLADSGTWTSATTGGLDADGEACADGEVPTFTFSQTSSVGAVRFTSMGAAATYRLKGRSVITDSPWGEPLDLTDNCGGSNQTITANDGNTTGIVYATATNDCSEFTWANVPYSASKPTLTNLSKGDVIWFTTGQYRNNFIHVVSSSANTLVVGFGDPGSTYGGGLAGWDGPAQLPTIGGNGNKRSLENYIDVDMTAVNQTVPNRILVSIQTGALSTVPTGGSGTGQRAGQCLITSTQTATAGSGAYYRIAGSIDGGGSTDTLILDPWVTMAAADTAAAFLATAGNAWVGPCVRPGDRWYAFEPIVQKPATAGTHYSSLLAVAGLCPEIERAWWPMATPAADGAGAWAELTNPVIGLGGQRGCTMDGPWAIGPVRHAGTAGYGLSLRDSQNTTVRNASIQGLYMTVAQNWRFHGFVWFDAQNLIFDGNNVSFVNNEAFYHQTRLEETSESDSDFEGSTITVRNSTIHDIWDVVTSTDLSSAIAFQANQTVGEFSLLAHDNLAWNVELNTIALSPTPKAGTVVNLHSNVFGPGHRVDEADATDRDMIYCGRVESTQNIVNNVILSDIDYNVSTAGTTRIIRNCERVVYNYIGEAGTAVANGSTTTGTEMVLHGNLIEGAGASAVGLSTSNTYQRGFDLTRDTLDTISVKHNLFRRFCPITTTASYAMQLGATALTDALDLTISHNSFGLYCPTITGVGNTPTSGTAGISFQSATTIGNLVVGSHVGQNLLMVGDLTHDAGADNYEIRPINCSSALTTAPSLTFRENVCSECGTSFACGEVCAYNCNTATLVNVTHEANSVDTSLLSPARRMEAVGTRGITDLRLRRESPAFAVGEADPVGSHYAGIISYRQAMQDADIPQDWLFQRATEDMEPDRSVLPPSLRFLIQTGGGGRSKLPAPY